ncbi:hypothetical protein KAJ27_24155 [bacterium]|nr:hypothetical protein [bacterium]
MIDSDIVFLQKPEFSNESSSKFSKIPDSKVIASMDADLGEMLVSPEYRSNTSDYLEQINSIYRKKTSRLSTRKTLLVNFILNRYGNSNAGELLSMYRELKPEVRNNLKTIANKFLTDKKQLVQILANNSSNSIKEIYAMHTDSDIGLISEKTGEETKFNKLMFP